MITHAVHESLTFEGEWWSPGEFGAAQEQNTHTSAGGSSEVGRLWREPRVAYCIDAIGHSIRLTSGCYEDSVTPTVDGENMRVLKCAAWQTDVPFFGPSAPSKSDTIWLLYWLNPVDPSKPYGGSGPLARSAYASHGARWLSLRQLEAQNRVTFSEGAERSLKAHSLRPVYDATPNYCKALRNAPANR